MTKNKLLSIAAIVMALNVVAVYRSCGRSERTPAQTHPDYIVAGGVLHKADSFLDDVAQRHWARHGVDLADLNIQSNPQDFMAYVSYRCKTGVCWKIDTIKSGEMVWYDVHGYPRVRGRCGNLISTSEQEDEPTVDTGSYTPEAKKFSLRRGMLNPEPVTDFIGLPPPVNPNQDTPQVIISQSSTVSGPPEVAGIYAPPSAGFPIVIFPIYVASSPIPENPSFYMAVTGLLLIGVRMFKR